MGNWGGTTGESRRRREQNADYWDQRMGEHSNRFHREIVRPHTRRLLSVSAGDSMLDVACGNGNFSRRLAELGASVTAIDYSPRMIENARHRCADCLDRITFRVVDAADPDQLAALSEEGPFDKAVSNMALMDISDISPLLRALTLLLRDDVPFVFSVTHPCFQTPGMRTIVQTQDVGSCIEVRRGIHVFQYATPGAYEGVALPGQPVPELYYHRPLADLFGLCFEAGFTIDGLVEPTFAAPETRTGFEWCEIPPTLIVRLRNSVSRA